MALLVFIVAVILGIITGNQAGDATGSGLIGFVVGFVAVNVFNIVGQIIRLLVIGGSAELAYRARRRRMFGKTKSY